MSLKTKGLSIGRFDQLFVFVHPLSVVEVISVIVSQELSISVLSLLGHFAFKNICF